MAGPRWAVSFGIHVDSSKPCARWVRTGKIGSTKASRLCMVEAAIGELLLGVGERRKGHHEQKAAEARAVAEGHEREAELSEDEKRARQVVRRDMRDEPPVV